MKHILILDVSLAVGSNNIFLEVEENIKLIDARRREIYEVSLSM